MWLRDKCALAQSSLNIDESCLEPGDLDRVGGHHSPRKLSLRVTHPNKKKAGGGEGRIKPVQTCLLIGKFLLLAFIGFHIDP